MAVIKPEIDQETVAGFLAGYYGGAITGLQRITMGEVSQVYAFTYADRDYVIRFSIFQDGFEHDRYAFDHFASQGIPIPEITATGEVDGVYFSISGKVAGTTLDRLSPLQRTRVLPAVVAMLDRIHQADLSASTGYGWLDNQGNGPSASWAEFLATSFDDPPSGFWQGWRQLFRTSCLEYNVFESLHARMRALMPYCAYERSLVHGDCHPQNIMSDGQRVTGVLDWANALYGDCVCDIAFLHLWSPQEHYPELFQAYYSDLQRAVSHYRERLLCYTYWLGLLQLRYYARMDQVQAYTSTRDYLFALPVRP